MHSIIIYLIFVLLFFLYYFIVNNYFSNTLLMLWFFVIKINVIRFNFIRKILFTDLYNNLVDTFIQVDTKKLNVANLRKQILPLSFISANYLMMELYQDSIVIVRYFG